MSGSAPRFRGACGNEYLGIDVGEAEDLAGLLGVLLEVFESPAIQEDLSDLVSPERSRHLSHDLEKQYLVVRHLLDAAQEATPSRNGDATPRCAVCGSHFPPAANRVYCGDTCKATAWRRRHQAAVVAVTVPAARPRRSFTVYQCGSCGSRSLGEQRCECGLFMARLGVGGTCPECDAAVAVGELLDDLADVDVRVMPLA